MPERVLRAVANPPTIFWAPYLPAAINMGLHMLLMVYGWGLLRLSPLTFIVTLLLVHIFIAAQGARQPHLSTMIICWSRNLLSTRNMPRTKRVRRYAP
jgi:type IV secretory pathway VirB3-like protein